MSKIHLKVTTEKKRGTQNFDSLSLKNLFPGQLLGSSNKGDVKCSPSESKTVYGFSFIFILKRIMTFSSQKIHVSLRNGVLFVHAWVAWVAC